MVKIGPAFFENVTESKIRRRGRSSFLTEEILVLAPLFFLILLMAAIIARVFYIQVLRYDYYKGLATSNRTRTALIPAPRGVVFDRAGHPLIANTAIFSISEKGKDKEITRDEALKLLSEGKKVKSEVRREYLYKDAFAHVLGYVGQVTSNQLLMNDYADYGISDTVGKSGLESEYESMLHGKNGTNLFEVDAQGIFTHTLGTNEPIPGQNITTTLDRDIQLSVRDAMKDVEKGAAVVSDPNTGAILALYSAPSFDPNLFTYNKSYEAEGKYKKREDVLLDGVDQPLLDRAIGGVYPPGSTFKLVTAVAALEKGKIKPDTKIEDTGILKVGDFSFGNWYFLQYGRKDGDVDVVKAITRSNDIFFYKAAESAGVDYVSSWAKKFGLGNTLGIDLPGEVKGTVPTMDWKEKNIGEPWYLGDTYHYGIGQGYLLTTPLQVNVFTNVFANDGVLYKPYLIEGKKQVLRKDFINKEYIDLVREGMKGACSAGGTGYSFFDFKVNNERLKIDNKDFIKTASDSAKTVRIEVGCKTGTAETTAQEDPHAWITVFAPYNKPEISVTVLVEKSGEGSQIAGPIATKILKDYFEKK